MWLKEAGFADWVRLKRSSYVIDGNPSFTLVRKLKMLKKDLKIWNKEVFSRIDIKIKKVIAC